MKKHYPKILAILMVALFGFYCTGCGADPESLTIPLGGTKVLYRPDTYDYEQNVGEGNQYYFAKYSWSLMQELLRVYGYIENGTFQRYSDTPSEDVTKPNRYSIENRPYLYDSVRYQIVEENVVTEGEDTYVEYVADTSLRWNWSFGDTDSSKYYISSTDYSIADYSPVKSDNLITNRYGFDSEENFNSFMDNIEAFYTSITTPYTTEYLGTASLDADIDTYSDYVRGVEYVMYCLSMELDPTGNITSNAVYDGENYQKTELRVTSSVFGLNNVPIKDAIERVRDVFTRRGTIVGITENQQGYLVDFILDEVIGESAQSNDIVKKNQITRTEGVDSITPQEPIELFRDYRGVVTEAVANVCDLVNIGVDNLKISDPFISSQIRNYERNAFYYNLGAEKGHEFDHIPALEYQSVAFMFNGEISFSNLWLVFKYDGSDPNVIEEGNVLKINVYLNFHKKGTQEVLHCYMGDDPNAPLQIEIPDGPVNIGESSHTLRWEGFKTAQYGTGVTIEEFNEPDALKCPYPPGSVESDTENRISQPLTLSGTNNARSYYQRIHSDNKPGEEYFSYGVLNPAMFEDCDYFEIAFEIVKDPKDIDKNYAFQVGVWELFENAY